MTTRFSRALCALAARALATLALGALPLAAHAADIDKDARAKGMKEAPAAVQKAGLACTVADAYFIGKVDTKTGGSQNAYEVACQQGSGYVVLTSDKETKSYDCLATVGQSLACKLPANADPTAGVKPLIASAGITCTPTKARYIGANATVAVYEVACQEGLGYVLQAPVPGSGAAAATQAVPCAQEPPTSSTACKLTTQAQTDAALAAMVQKSGHSCQVSASRYMGSNPKSGESYTEVGCGAQPGFVLAMAKGGAFERTLTCSEAKAIGGCTLTDPAKVAASETADYSARLAAAGFPCQVAKSRTIGTDSKQDTVVEVACSNRPDGAVAVFPASTTAKVEVLDCVQGQQFGPSAACTLTQPTALYARYTQELSAKNSSTCQVSNAKWLAGAGSSNYVETACASGKPGFVLQLSKTNAILDIMSCGQAKASGVSCTLPTNVGH